MTIGVGKSPFVQTGTGEDAGTKDDSTKAKASTPRQSQVHVRHPMAPRVPRHAPEDAGAERADGLRPRSSTPFARPQAPEAAAASAHDHAAVDGHTQLIKFQGQETRIGIALHEQAAQEPLAPAEAELKYQQLQKKDAARRALLTGGPPGTHLQVLKAVCGDGLNLGLIASFGFNGWNVTAQMLIANAVRKRLPPHLSPAEREAVCATAAFLGASFASGFGALGASIFWAPLGVATAQQATGAWEIQKQDLELLFPNPDPYIDRDQGITKSRREYEAELKTAVLARKQCEVQQASFGLDTKKAFVLITGGFWLFHSARIGMAPLEQSPWAEGTQAAASAFLGAAAGMAWLSTMKWRSDVAIQDDVSRSGKAPAGSTRPMKLHFVAEAPARDKDASAFVSKFDRSWTAFADGRKGTELAVFMVVQWLKLSLSVHAATAPSPMIQAAAGAASDGADDNTKMLVKMGATALSYTWALFVLLVYFPAIGAARVRPKPPSDEEPLLGIQDDDADEVLQALLANAGFPHGDAVGPEPEAPEATGAGHSEDQGGRDAAGENQAGPSGTP